MKDAFPENSALPSTKSAPPSVDGSVPYVLLSSEYGIHETIKARLRPWLSGKSLRYSLGAESSAPPEVFGGLRDSLSRWTGRRRQKTPPPPLPSSRAFQALFPRMRRVEQSQGPHCGKASRRPQSGQAKAPERHHPQFAFSSHRVFPSLSLCLARALFLSRSLAISLFLSLYRSLFSRLPAHDAEGVSMPNLSYKKHGLLPCNQVPPPSPPATRNPKPMPDPGYTICPEMAQSPPPRSGNNAEGCASSGVSRHVTEA